MISREKYLLTCLAEEANEVAVRASKAIRFGLEEAQPGQDENNAERLMRELNDMMAVIQMLRNETVFDDQWCARSQAEKRFKVNHFYDYSVSLGEAVSPAEKGQ